MADFVLFPVLWSLVQAAHGGSVQTQWSPITLQGAGLFHMAMGAILGIAAFGRTQEKIAGANNGGMAAAPAVSSFSAQPTNSFSASAPTIAPVSFSSGGIAAGKARPAEFDHPAI
jgi:hypothetical protein